MQSKRRKVMQSEGRQMIASVYHFLKTEYDFTVTYQEPNSDVSNLRNITQRTADATGVSDRTVQRIIREEKDMPSTSAPKFQDPMKRRRKRANKVTVDGFTAAVVRSTIQEFYVKHKEVPTLAKLKSIFQDKIAFSGCLETLRTLLKKLGYDWRKTDKNKKVMLERHDIQLWRLKYIEQITEYRSRGRPIVYTNESYVLTTHVRSACSDAGFLDKLCLVYEANSATGDYTSKVNFDNYVKWLDEQLLPNLPAQSVIVLDSYHRTRAEKLPTSTSSRSEMQQWLTAKDIQFDSDLLKVELYDIIKKHRSNFMTYKIDDYIKSKGFEVLRLPPYHPELNAMEKIWGVIKHCVALKTVEQNAVNTEELILESIENLSSETWSEAFEGVIQKEAEYMAYLDTELDFMFNLQDDSEENETLSEESASDSN